MQSLFISAGVLGLWVVLTALPAVGQVDSARRVAGGRGPGNMPAPRTKLETMENRRGAVIVRAHTEIANVQGEDGSFLRIAAVELTDLAKETREYGVMVAVHAARDLDGESNVVLAYIDADEIGALADALEALAKLDRATTRMGEFEALYRTKGDFEVRNFNSNGARMASIACAHVAPLTGDVTWSVGYFQMTRLAEVRSQFLAASDALAKLRDEDREANK